ncbi:hypothetical protein MPSEU_000101300 [Mayamaea pseudoterrestris]|nr:hypothetical protein MPSEU_000101300 [Mayamaea pseudoterrestris]
MRWIEILSQILLFLLIFGMSATVNYKHFQTQLQNRRAILSGLALQFFLIPLLGFICVLGFRLDYPTGLALLVVTSSPGGSYSNWWCSLFNADLALSVTMTAISTILSAVILPINLLVYARYCYQDDNVDAMIDWGSLIMALIVVILAIAAGLFVSHHFGSDGARQNHFVKILANRIGNAAGAILVVISFFIANADEDARIWHREASFYWAIIIPSSGSLLAATAVGILLRLVKPERVAMAIEVSYQNIGIASSVAISMFQGDDRAAAMGVPFFYGVMEALMAFIYCVGAWKLGWTKAPTNVSFITMLVTSYEVLESEEGAAEHLVEANEDEADGYYMVNVTTNEHPGDTKVVKGKTQSAVV